MKSKKEELCKCGHAHFKSIIWEGNYSNVCMEDGCHCNKYIPTHPVVAKGRTAESVPTKLSPEADSLTSQELKDEKFIWTSEEIALSETLIGNEQFIPVEKLVEELDIFAEKLPTYFGWSNLDGNRKVLKRRIKGLKLKLSLDKGDEKQ